MGPAPAELLTAAEALVAATRVLTKAGVRDAGLDTELLLRHVLGWDRARLIASPGHRLGAAERERFEALVAERARRRPLQHLVGTAHFWRHEFLVSPDVLVPRPETEILVETALSLLKPLRDPIVVDIGTGSGCIALSLAAERPDAIVHATDISERALAVARENGSRLGLGNRVVFHHGDLLAPVAHLASRIDLVISNPPYVDGSEIEGLEPEVRDHDPRLALVPPSGDRYEIYRRLAGEAAHVLKPGGHLAVEIGTGMADGVSAILEAAVGPVVMATDLAGIVRVLSASRSRP